MLNLTNDEKQYILNALDQEIRRTGLKTAAFALGIVHKLQNAAEAEAEVAAPVEAPTEAE